MSQHDARQQRQPTVSPLVLLPLQDDVVLDQGRLALAHPTSLGVRHDNMVLNENISARVIR